ncbi:hypothetical protein NA57DRAFT_54804 [Rhizodiscina lignyota]|uniref:DUF7598 domain-containing protein n=1 Tax=Rhizodiscina lignyota TaxID=1504668 RepID=A0A9P4IFP9_9PEZI|nr:hypothetical protein NA57DRAFT_54804 [Rhizodiscina lignyota]
MPLSSKRLAGPGYIILNTLRVMNIIGLLAVVTASVVMLVNAFTANISKFFFFDAVSHVITFFISIFLAISEMSLFRSYFQRNWPLFGPDHSFVMLGLSMVVLGVNILGNMNKQAMSQKALGLAFWRIVLASAIIVLVLGVFNIVASYVFRDKKLGITARKVRSHGAVAIPDQPEYYAPSMTKKAPLSIRTTLPSSSASLPTASSIYSPVKSIKTPTSATKTSAATAALRFPARAYRAARESILPSYHSSSPTRTRVTPTETSRPMEISAPMNINPQFAHLVKPDNDHHPSRREQEGASPGGWV